MGPPCHGPCRNPGGPCRGCTPMSADPQAPWPGTAPKLIRATPGPHGPALTRLHLQSGFPKPGCQPAVPGGSSLSCPPSPSPRLNHPRAGRTPSARLSTRTPLGSPPPPSLEAAFCFSQRLPSFPDVVSLTPPHPHKQSSRPAGSPSSSTAGLGPSPLPDLGSDRERPLPLGSATATTGSPGLGIQKVLDQGLLKKQTKVRSQAAAQNAG